MNPIDNQALLSEEEAIKEKLEDLRSRIAQVHEGLESVKECSRLSNFLQKLYEIREGVNQLEQGLLQTHLRCCISPKIKVPGEVIVAVSSLSKKRHGAILVIEQEDIVDDYLKGGFVVEAVASALVIENIFYPGSPLHDGAVIIRKGNIVKASCLLPLAPHALELGDLGLGTRHQAAIGLSEVSDALIIVVSEEKGWVSLAIEGRLYPNLGTFALLQKLGNAAEGGT
ncbi:MAG: DNA integrity scanning protein DisA nucleotide-binding domain protein [Deltaproteobacteria bacterium]|nr:DNA integrity scanning protein DisA nucleotide-binding domain protein [Deltaproteobacteria bacterium]